MVYDLIKKFKEKTGFLECLKDLKKIKRTKFKLIVAPLFGIGVARLHILKKKFYIPELNHKNFSSNKIYIKFD